MTWLKELRTEKGLTQKQVAEEADVARGAYSNIENEERRPSVPVAKRIAAVLEFDWTRFFEDKGRSVTGPLSPRNDGEHGRESA